MKPYVNSCQPTRILVVHLSLYSTVVRQMSLWKKIQEYVVKEENGSSKDLLKI